MPPSGDGNRFSLLDPDNGTAKRKKSSKRKYTSYEDAFPTLESPSFNPDDEAKFIVIKPKDDKSSLATINPFILAQKIKAVSTNFTKTKILRDGSILLLCKNMAIANNFKDNLQKINETEVTVELHKDLNYTKGVVFASSLKYVTEEQIVKGMEHEHVTQAHHIKKKAKDSKNNEFETTGLVVLTFNRFSLPKYVNIGLERCEVREYIPNPMRCGHCTKIGHTAKRCADKNSNKPETCGICCLAKNDEHKKCNMKACLNCQTIGDHSTVDPKCPKYAIEKEVIKLQLRQKLTRFEARKLYYATYASPPSMPFRSFAEAIKQQITPQNHETTKISTQSTESTTKSTEITTQSTDITPQSTEPAQPTLINDELNITQISSTPNNKPNETIQVQQQTKTKLNQQNHPTEIYKNQPTIINNSDQCDPKFKENLKKNGNKKSTNQAELMTIDED